MAKIFQSRTPVGGFVKRDGAWLNWKHGNPSDVLCGGHLRQPDDFISYGQWRHKFSFHSQPTQGKRSKIDLDQTSSSRPTATRANDHDDDFNTPITTRTHSNHNCFQFQ